MRRNFRRTICHKHRWNVCWNNIDPIHQGNIEPLPDTETTWKIDVNNLSVRSLPGLLLLFLDKLDGFANKNEEFYNPRIKKILVTINGMPHQLFATGL